MVQLIEELLDVGIHHPPEPLARRLVDGFQRIQSAFLRSEPEGAPFKVRLEDRLQEQLAGRLYHAIAHRGDSQGARPGGVARFGDFHPPHRLGAIGLVAQALRDLRQKLRDTLGLDLGQRLLVDPSDAPIPAHQLPGTLQEIRQRQPVIQRVEAAFGITLRGLVELRLEHDRSVFGWISLIDTHRTVLLSLHSPAAGPSLGRGFVVPSLPTVLCPAPTPSGPGSSAARTAPSLPTQEGLSSSVNDCPDIPRPLRRRVLNGCTSQGFTASVAFTQHSRVRLPLSPLPGCVTTLQTSRNAADCRLARPPEEGFVSGLRRGDFAPFSIRRRSATRRLGPYRDRTFTGKPLTASLDTRMLPHSGMRSSACRTRLP